MRKSKGQPSHSGKQSSPYKEVEPQIDIKRKRKRKLSQTVHPLLVHKSHSLPNVNINGFASSHSPPSPHSEKVQLTTEELEKKKTSLPYLEKIEYINIQLRQRGFVLDKQSEIGGKVNHDKDDSWIDPITLRDNPVMKLSPTKKKNKKTIHSSLNNCQNNDISSHLPTSKTLQSGSHENGFKTTYPRFCALISNCLALSPKSKPITWLLRTIEDIYDSYYHVERKRETTSIDAPENNEGCGKQIAAPYFVRRYFVHLLGVETIADQECVDFINAIDLSKSEFPDVLIFSFFLQEFYDDDSLLFFVHLRHLVQQEYGLQLKLKEKLSINGVFNRKFISEKMIYMKNHPKIPDGTQEVYLSYSASRCILMKLLGDANLAQYFNKYLLKKKFEYHSMEFFSEKSSSKYTSDEERIKLISLINFQICVLDMFRNTDEDIVSKIKYKDDGESITILTQLQKTVSFDSNISELQEQQKDQIQNLNWLKVELLKLKRANVNGKKRTQILLAQNRILRAERDLANTNQKLCTTEKQINSVWDSVILSSSTNEKKKRKRKPPEEETMKKNANIVSVVERFHCWISRLEHKQSVKSRASSLLNRKWEDQLEELRVKSIIRIQRAYRERQRLRQEKSNAEQMLAEKREEKKLKLAQQRLDAKRLNQQQSKQAQRHQARMLAKQNRLKEENEAMEKRNQRLVRRHRDVEVQRRMEVHQANLVKRCFCRWQKYLSIHLHIEAKKFAQARPFFMRWKGYIAIILRDQRAAKAIQRSYRYYKFRCKVRYSQYLREKFVKRMQQRRLISAFDSWEHQVTQNIQIRLYKQQCRRRSLLSHFSSWSIYVNLCHDARLRVSINLAHYYGRKKLLKNVSVIALQMRSARIISRNYRGYSSRCYVTMMRRLHNQQSSGVQLLRTRIAQRVLFKIFLNWVHYAYTQRVVREKQYHNSQQRQRSHLEAWKKYVFVIVVRDKAARLLQERDACVLIQRQIRRFLCRQRVKILLKRHRAAIILQCWCRVCLVKIWIERLRLERMMAIRVQKNWRSRCARKMMHSIRVEKMLTSALNGDYYQLQQVLEFQASNHYIEEMSQTFVDFEGNSPLHVAAQALSKRCIKLCLRYGFDINQPNRLGQTPLHTLLVNKDQLNEQERMSCANLMDTMIDYGGWHEALDGEGNSPLLYAAIVGQHETIEVLIDREADRFRRNKHQKNALQLAVMFNQLDTVETLLQYGFPLDIRDGDDDSTLIHDCAAEGYTEMLELLLKYIQSENDLLNSQDKDGFTPLMYSVTNGKQSIVEYLCMEIGVDLSILDKSGRSALHTAAQLGKKEMIQVLCECDAELNLQDQFGDTPLHLLCDQIEEKYEDCCTILLSYGARTDIQNLHGNQPCHLAAGNGNEKIILSLLEYNADLNCKNYEGQTPMGMGRMYGHKHIVTLLREYSIEEQQILQEIDEEESDNLPKRSTDQWQKAIKSSIAIGTLQEWTEYMDNELGQPFYHNNMDSTSMWKRPLEFEAALGNEWIHVYDETQQIYYYFNQLTQETRWEAPIPQPSRLQELLLNTGQQKKLRMRLKRSANDVVPESTGSDYLRSWAANDEENRLLKQQNQAAIKIQSQLRRILAVQRVHEQRQKLYYVCKLQRRFRCHQAAIITRTKYLQKCAAIVLQRIVRGFLARTWYHNNFSFLCQELVERKSALLIQKRFRGNIGRRRARLNRMIRTGPKSYFEWKQTVQQATLVETVGLWDQMLVSGESDVVFYRQQITGTCTWVKPDIWIERDRQQFEQRQDMYYFGYTNEMQRSAILLQSLYRARIARQNFQLLLKGVKIFETAEAAYLASPTNLTALCNYMLYVHVYQTDYDRARPLYERAMSLMSERGPDIPFICFSYALYLHVTRQEDSIVVQDLIERANQMDPYRVKFKFAFLGFFRQSLILKPDDAQTNLNYAICRQLIYQDYKEAKEHFLRAILGDPSNKLIMTLFNEMLQENHDEMDGFELFMEWQAKDVAKQDQARRERFEQDQEFNKRTEAAVLIQKIYRARYARRKLHRNVSSNKMMASLVINAQTQERQSQMDERDYYQIQLLFAETGGKIDLTDAIWQKLGLTDVHDDWMPTLRDSTGQNECSMEQFCSWWVSGNDATLWEVCDDDGSVFYYNIETGTSQWVKPRWRPVLPTIIPDDSNKACSDRGNFENENEKLLLSTANHNQAEQSNSFDESQWEICDDGEGNTFYYNSSTGESTWTNPLQVDEGSSTSEETEKSNRQSETEEWTEHVDEEGNTFYYNLRRCESVWERPKNAKIVVGVENWVSVVDETVVETESDWQEVQDADGYIYYYDAISGATSWVKPEEFSPKNNEGKDSSNWEVVQSEDDGTVYYYNNVTGESQWERPKSLDAKCVPLTIEQSDSNWEENSDEDGNIFYYNIITGESQWEKPSIK